MGGGASCESVSLFKLVVQLFLFIGLADVASHYYDTDSDSDSDTDTDTDTDMSMAD